MLLGSDVAKMGMGLASLQNVAKEKWLKIRGF